MGIAARLNWPRDSEGWPHRDAGHLVQCGGQQWFVQQMGQGPSLLLIHGTGASTHSWRGMLPSLARDFKVLAIDLPGHGFSGMPPAAQLSMPAMARALGELLTQLKLQPALLVGHSAGAAIAIRMVLDGHATPQAIVSFNGALLPLAGLAGQVFLPMARLMAAAPFMPQLFAWRAADKVVLQRLIDGTGSTLDAEGMALYSRLVANPGHVQGALGMMANWDLAALQRDLPKLRVPVSLLVASQDRAVPPTQARQALALLRSAPGSTLTEWPGLGHLAHEEQPQRAAELVLALARTSARGPTEARATA
jgi:magnesium chelatase accessory protein